MYKTVEWLNKLITCAKKKRYEKIRLYVAPDGYGAVRGYPIEDGYRSEGWPSIWKCVKVAGISSGAGNGHHHQIQVPDYDAGFFQAQFDLMDGVRCELYHPKPKHKHVDRYGQLIHIAFLSEIESLCDEMVDLENPDWSAVYFLMSESAWWLIA